MSSRRLAVPPPYALASVALVMLAAAIFPFAHRLLPQLGPLAPASLIAASAVEVATFGVLVALYARVPRRSTAILALAYLGCATLTAIQAGCLPLGFDDGPFFHVGLGVAPLLYVARSIGFAGCAFAYAALRGPQERVLAAGPARRYLFAASALAVASTTLVIAAAVRFGPSFALVPAGDAPAHGVPGALVLFALCGLAGVAIFRRGVRDGVDAGLVLTALALTLDVGLYLIDGRRYTGAWYGMYVLYLAASSFVLVASVAGLLRWRTRALNLEAMLSEQLRRVEHHSRRLETFWKLASQAPLDDDAFLRAVLQESSAGVRPGPRFFGTISHLDGAEIVIDMNDDEGAIDGALVAGARLPLARTVISELLRTGRTCSWDDVRAHAEIAHVARIAEMPWRAVIGTPFRVGPTVYFLVFTSESALPEAFAAEDVAYVEIVAALCASRLQQRVQFERLQHQSTHDPLTGLPNRVAFRVAACRELAAGEPLALAVVDVDRFRELNETHGHQTADALLVEIGAGVAARAGETSLVARLGGDTFGVLMRGVTSREDAERRVETIHALFADAFGTGDRDGTQRVPVSASIGVAMAPHDASAFERLLARADAALRTAKEGGRARWSFFERALEDAFGRARRMQNDLAEALVRGEFVLYFQPHVDIASGTTVGAEALIRWRHPERGLLAPAEFIPFAEEHGMLGAIGHWVMRETVRASRSWRAADPAFRMWFNVSGSELNDPALVQRLHELGEDARGIGVEISESIAMRDVQTTMRTVAAMREAGVAVALDDFGTGYSSLAHLKRLPIDVLKIDRLFTAGIPDDAHDAAIVAAVVGIASRFGFTTIAEGVETPRQASALLAAGCTQAQGFGYGAPMGEAEFNAYLQRARNSRRGAAYMRA
ncbi:MAG TPA: EAL domain-containing protein [Candidatus Elarobacter sp.]|jgi:diguanylate cyclase (GGDEF)-like protein